MSTATFRLDRHPHKTLRIVNVAFDVGSDSLHWAMRPGDLMITGECENTSSEIRKTLDQIAARARKQGDCEVRIICESTGVYHRRLLQIAESLDMRTALVHGEAVPEEEHFFA